MTKQVAVIKLKPVRNEVERLKSENRERFLEAFVPYMQECIINMNSEGHSTTQIRGLSDNMRNFRHNGHAVSRDLSFEGSNIELARVLVDRLNGVFPGICLIDSDGKGAGHPAISWADCP